MNTSQHDTMSFASGINSAAPTLLMLTPIEARATDAFCPFWNENVDLKHLVPIFQCVLGKVELEA